MVFEIEDDQYEQSFTAREIDNSRMAALAAEVDCEVVDVLGGHRKWVRLRHTNTSN